MELKFIFSQFGNGYYKKNNEEILTARAEPWEKVNISVILETAAVCASFHVQSAHCQP